MPLPGIKWLASVAYIIERTLDKINDQGRGIIQTSKFYPCLSMVQFHVALDRANVDTLVLSLGPTRRGNLLIEFGHQRNSG